MSAGSRASSRAAGRAGPLGAGVGLLLAVAAASCSPDGRSAHGYRLDVPRGWKRDGGAEPIVPGTILERYIVPTESGEGSLVVFRSSYRPRTTASQLLIERTNLLRSLPSLVIHDAGEVAVGDRAAVFFDLTAEGTGKALSPTGLGKPVPPAGEEQVPTRRLWIAVLRGPELGTLEVFLHCPDVEEATLRQAWEEILGSLRA